MLTTSQHCSPKSLMSSSLSWPFYEIWWSGTAPAGWTAPSNHLPLQCRLHSSFNHTLQLAEEQPAGDNARHRQLPDFRAPLPSRFHVISTVLVTMLSSASPREGCGEEGGALLTSPLPPVLPWLTVSPSGSSHSFFSSRSFCFSHSSHSSCSSRPTPFRPSPTPSFSPYPSPSPPSSCSPYLSCSPSSPSCSPACAWA